MTVTDTGACTVYKYVIVEKRRKAVLYQRQHCATKRDKDRFVTLYREQLGSKFAASIWMEP